MAATDLKVKVKVNLDHESLRQSVFDILHAYSDWLDTSALLAAPKRDDHRSHDDLVNEFLDQRATKQNGEQ